MAAQFIASADLDAQIVYVLNAAATWAGAIEDGSQPAEAIELARRQSCIEVLNAIAGNPQHGYWGELAQYVDVVSGDFLPAHDGEIGIPIIVPFFGQQARTGLVATSQQIDDWRAETAENPMFTGGGDGIGVPHNQADANGRRSAISCRFAVTDSVLDFTGYGAQVPMIIITDNMADTKIAIGVAPAVTKLAIPKLVKPGSPVYQIATLFGTLGEKDLVKIAGGIQRVSPVPTIAQLQTKL